MLVTSCCYVCFVLFYVFDFVQVILTLDTHLNCLKHCIFEHLFDLNNRLIPEYCFAFTTNVIVFQKKSYVSFLSLLYYRYDDLVDGKWSSWSQWTKCDVTCANGTQIRTRSCTNPAPAYGGVNCSGTNRDTMPCTLDPCPGNFDAATTFCLPILYGKY